MPGWDFAAAAPVPPSSAGSGPLHLLRPGELFWDFSEGMLAVVGSHRCDGELGALGFPGFLWSAAGGREAAPGCWVSSGAPEGCRGGVGGCRIQGEGVGDKEGMRDGKGMRDKEGMRSVEGMRDGKGSRALGVWRLPRTKPLSRSCCSDPILKLQARPIPGSQWEHLPPWAGIPSLEP